MIIEIICLVIVIFTLLFNWLSSMHYNFKLIKQLRRATELLAKINEGIIEGKIIFLDGNSEQVKK